MHSGCKSVRVMSHSKGSGKLEQVIPAEDMQPNLISWSVILKEVQNLLDSKYLQHEEYSIRLVKQLKTILFMQKRRVNSNKIL